MKSRAYQEIAQKGKWEGKLEGKLEIAKALLQKRMSLEFIVEVTGLSKKQVLAIGKAKRGRKVAVHKN
jgi:predicted transposase/invertase (TIGR01784 family)